MKKQPDTIKSFNIQTISGAFNYPDLYSDLAKHSTEENYSIWPSIVPTTWMPIFVGNDDYDGVGLSISGGDALGRHAYNIAAIYDSKNDLGSGALLYNYNNQWSVLGLRSQSDGSVLGTDYINIRREDTIEVARTNLINAFDNQLKMTLGANSTIEYDLPYDNLFESKRNSRKNAVVGARLDFDNREFYSQSISPTWGTQGMILWESNEYVESDYSGDVVNAGASHFIDLPGNQVVALNVQGAYGFENPKAFELGGEESLLAQPLFGRDTWALRGYDENTQRGNRIQTNSLEYRIPLANVESGWDLFPAGIGAVSGTLFTDHGAAWFDEQKMDYLTSVGVELNVELLLAYSFPVPIKFGYARGFDGEKGGNRSYVSAGFAF